MLLLMLMPRTSRALLQALALNGQLRSRRSGAPGTDGAPDGDDETAAAPEAAPPTPAAPAATPAATPAAPAASTEQDAGSDVDLAGDAVSDAGTVRTHSVSRAGIGQRRVSDRISRSAVVSVLLAYGLTPPNKVHRRRPDRPINAKR